MTAQTRTPAAETRGTTEEERDPLGPRASDEAEEEPPQRGAVTEVRGRMTQTLDSSRGVFSDRSFTAMETAVRLDGRRGTASFGLSGRWREGLDGDLLGGVPPYYLTEAWYRHEIGDGSGFSLGRQYLTGAGGELVDGLAADTRWGDRISVGIFAGFRPDPFDFGVRGDAATAGLYSGWAGNEYGGVTSRQALVFNWFGKRLDRAYLSWEADKRFGDDLWLRQYLVADFAPGGNPGLTTYSLGMDWRANEELQLSWQGDAYRSAPYRTGSTDVPADTSYTYSSLLSLRHWFSKDYIGALSASYAYRELDRESSLSFTGGLTATNWLGSGIDADLGYSATRYYNAFFEDYSAGLRRPFGLRLSLGVGARYSRNVANDAVAQAESRFSTFYGTANYIVSDRIDLSVYYEYQQAQLLNGTTEGLGFDRDPERVGSRDSSDGYNLSVALNWRF